MSRSAEPVVALVLPITVRVVVDDNGRHDDFRILKFGLDHVPSPRRNAVWLAIPVVVKHYSRGLCRLFDASQEMVTSEAHVSITST